MRTFGLLLATAIPCWASANTVVVAPVLPSGVDEKVALNVHQLLSSELDFASGVDSVEDLTARPGTLTTRCMTSSSCLGAIARQHGGDQLVTGIVHSRGTDYGIELLLYDTGKNTIVRRKEFPSSSDPTQMANGMTGIVNELLTGDDPSAAAAAVPVVADFDADDDEMTFDEDPIAVGGVGGIAGGVVGGVVSPPPAPPTALEDDPLADISFGKVTKEDIDAISFGAPTSPAPAPPPPAAVAPQPPSPVARTSPPREPRTRTDRPSRPTESRAAVERGSAELLQLSIRAGYANYYRFSFITAGIEVAVPVVAGLHILGGVESYSAKRLLPPDLELELAVGSEWNTIFPYNLGAMYKFTTGIAQPYVGGEMIFSQYYRDEVGSDWAAGARLRGGADFMVNDVFGVNLNVAFGTWSGKNWALIEQGVGRSGALPQISAGTVLAF